MGGEKNWDRRAGNRRSLCWEAAFLAPTFGTPSEEKMLSRITDTNANELGDFYVRIVTFGTVPVLTWLAYQFPDFCSGLMRFIQPTLEVMK
jgi:hypothetical protein